jgi:putative ATP-binding cassette transporter
LRLATPAGETLIEDFDLRVRRGERVLIVGDLAVTLAFFKAVAGLWPWGSGEIELPKGPDLAFVPQHPFLPAGSLRAVMCYPRNSGYYDDPTLHRALECAGVAWLSPRLDESDDWNRVLPLGTQQRLGMARLFLHKPAWVFLDEAINTFDVKGRAGMMATLHHELPSSTILAISLHGDEDHFYDRKVELHRPQKEHAETEEAPLTLIAAGSVSSGRRV